MEMNITDAALSRAPHNYQYEVADELTPGEGGDQLYSCHGHVISSRSKSALVILIPLFLGAVASNSCVVYVLRRFGAVIGKVTCHFITLFMVTDLMKVFLVILPSIIRICNLEVLSGSMCHAGYWINLFLLQSSFMTLGLSAYDRVMVLRKSESYGPNKSRLKNTLLFSVLIPLSYAVFDVAYTKIYEAKNSDIGHVSEQSSICYDQKLGWCMTKTAPHEHEQQSDKGSKRSGVFICQAQVMTVLILIGQFTLQSGHSNYKKLFNDESREGKYFTLMYGLTTWLYLPSMLVTLMDTFTSTVFPNTYYEEFYIYIYMLQLMPSMCNAYPLLLSYKEYIFPTLVASPAHYTPVKPDTSATADSTTEDRREQIYRRISRLQLPTRDLLSCHSSSASKTLTGGTLTKSPDLTTARHDPGSPVRGAGGRDKDYFDTMVMRGLGGERDVIANLQAIERTEV